MRFAGPFFGLRASQLIHDRRSARWSAVRRPHERGAADGDAPMAIASPARSSRQHGPPARWPRPEPPAWSRRPWPLQEKSRKTCRGSGVQLLTQCPRSIQIGACLLLMRDVSGQTPEERALRRWLARNIHLHIKFIHLSRHFGIEPRSRPDRGRVRHGGLWPCAIWKPQARMAIQQLRLR